MRILLYCPMNPTAPKLWRRTMESILKMEWAEPIDYLFSANDNPYDQPYLNITHQYNKARQQALDGDYDYLLTVESDMIVPVDTLKRLTALSCGVAYGLYIFRHVKHTWSAYTTLEDRQGVSLSDDPDRARATWGRVLDVAGVGLGCTLISKNTLKRVKFRLFENDTKYTACDWLFALDCAALDISQRCDTGVICGHQSYKPYPMILWPDVNEPSLYRRDSLPGVELKPIESGQQFSVGMGETVLIKADNEQTIPDSDNALLQTPASVEGQSSKPKKSKRS
jgi:hypothetical protein